MVVASGALLSFSLGPVQPFIASARTVRDLWTGSFLLSWLTFAAMKPVLEQLDETAFVIPSLEDNPLYRRYHLGESVLPRDLVTPCLPNRFLVRVPDAATARNLAGKCENRCRTAWAKVETAVRLELTRLVPGLDPFKLWQKQLDDLFEVRTVVLPLAEVTPEQTQGLFQESLDGWSLQFDLLGGLLDATRSVKHVPRYAVSAERVPQKCSLLGTYEQLGPAGLEESRKFWEAFATDAAHRGTRTEPNERLCALSLVKRFLWADYFSTREQFDLPVSELRYSDTATIAASFWLREAGINPEEIRRRQGDWSGQWLHWTRSDPPGEQPCPDPVWQEIRNRKQACREKPPTYYAILVLDGDHMGKIMRNAGSVERSREFSRVLMQFALHHVPEIVEDRFDGELIYAGGDDVLAVLPTRNALACARELEKAYRDLWAELGPDPEATMSGGITIAHYKEDLRFALTQARAAEGAAKKAGRNALMLRVLRRSGEHAGAVLGWDQTHELDELVKQFIAGFSDRWTYKLRAELPTLAVADSSAVDRFQAELARLLDRVEAPAGDSHAVCSLALGLLGNYRAWTEAAERNKDNRRSLPRVLTEFVTLCQSASFLARGREE